MSKKVLVLYYTQSGQLADIVNNFTLPFSEPDIIVEKVFIKPVNDFKFPWTGERFWDAMPESVLGIPVELQTFEFKETAYDLIVFAYQPWFLSPSIPATSILAHPSFKKVVANTPVITLIGSRNMWINSQARVKKSLEELHAKLVGNIALFDRHNNHASAVTILYWMLTGKKDKYLGIFPKPGISEEDILHTKVYGELVKQYLLKGNWEGLQQDVVKNKGLEVKTNLMFIEARAKKLFLIWANLASNSKRRPVVLYFFKYYLLIALFIIAPIVLLVYRIIFAPFLQKNIRKQKERIMGIAGN